MRPLFATAPHKVIAHPADGNGDWRGGIGTAAGSGETIGTGPTDLRGGADFLAASFLALALVALAFFGDGLLCDAAFLRRDATTLRFSGRFCFAFFAAFPALRFFAMSFSPSTQAATRP